MSANGGSATHAFCDPGLAASPQTSQVLLVPGATAPASRAGKSSLRISAYRAKIDPGQGDQIQGRRSLG